MTENEVLEMCDKINQEKQAMLEDIREAIIDKLEVARNKHYKAAYKAVDEDSMALGWSYRYRGKYCRGLGLNEAIEIVKEVLNDGEI